MGWVFKYSFDSVLFVIKGGQPKGLQNNILPKLGDKQGLKRL